MKEEPEFKKSCVRVGMEFLKKHKKKAIGIGGAIVLGICKLPIVELLDLISTRWSDQSQIIGWGATLPIGALLLIIGILIGVIGWKIIKLASRWDIEK